MCGDFAHSGMTVSHGVYETQQNVKSLFLVAR